MYITMKSFLYVMLLSLWGCLFTPTDCWAWGIGVHLQAGSWLLENMKVNRILAGEPWQITANIPTARCMAGQNWRWDGVSFSILYPAESPALQGNNASCVLKVENAAGSLLLTGDVETVAERQLVARYANELAADVVVAPHHGSASSSSPFFVSATAAAYVLYSAGYANRWGFPDERVVKRWTAAGADSMNTGRSGAIQIYFGLHGLSPPTGFREENRRWFHHP